MAWRAWRMVAILVGTLGLASAAEAQSEVAATLSVLAPPVERIPAGAGAAEPGVSGMNLADGDRIRTGARSIALITFLNGTTVTVLPDSEVTVKQAASERGTGAMRLFIHAGRVWARVVQAAGSRSALTLESNDYSATARDGLIGAERRPEGFVCWTRRGLMIIENSAGQSEAVLMAGQRAWARRGWPVTPEPFVAGASTIEIEASGPILPLLQMPDGGVAAGFLAEDVEVNQVFGSLTASRGRQRWVVEVPAGAPGTYTLILTGAGAGPFTAQVSARYAGFRVYRQALTGEIRPGERLVTRIVPSVKGDDPQTARVAGASVDGLRAWDGEEAAAVVAAPGSGRAPGMN
jgi:FecR-like protein